MRIPRKPKYPTVVTRQDTHRLFDTGRLWTKETRSGGQVSNRGGLSLKRCGVSAGQLEADDPGPQTPVLDPGGSSTGVRC